MRYKYFRVLRLVEASPKKTPRAEIYFIQSIKTSANCFDERVSAYPAIIQSKMKNMACGARVDEKPFLSKILGFGYGRKLSHKGDHKLFRIEHY